MSDSKTLPTSVDPLPSELSCDVAVVGYGPVGMMCAALLSQLNLNVVVIEKHFSRYHLSRAGHFDGEIMRIFQQLGLAEKMELEAQGVTQYSLLDASLNILQEVDRGSGGLDWQTSYLCPSVRTEAILDARVRELNATIFMGVTAEAIDDRGDDGVKLTARRTNSDLNTPPMILNARFVIGADGANSSVRTLIGSKRTDLGFNPWDNLIVDFEQADPDKEYPQLKGLYQVLNWRRPAHVARWGGNKMSRFEWLRLDGESREQLASDESVWELLRAWDITPVEGKIVRKVFYTFEASLVDKWRASNVFLVGDAAHTMPPFMGQGMCAGLRDAMNLSWKLAAVVSGQASKQFLDTYEVERKDHVLAFINMSIRVGELTMVTSEEVAAKRDVMLRSGTAPDPPPIPRIQRGVILSLMRIVLK